MTMKKTIAVIGSAAALTFAGAGLAAAEETGDQVQDPATTQTETENETEVTNGEGVTDGADTPAEVTAIAKQLCGAISDYDFLGSAVGVAPGLSGTECEANATAAVGAAFSGDISGAIDILRDIDTEGDEETEETEIPAFGS